MTLKTGYIAGIARGHNAGVCLLKDDEIVFSIEEERLSRQKYDGGPIASIVKILDYTDKIDYLVVAHTSPLATDPNKIDYSGDDIYTATARKLGLISRNENNFQHPQVIDLSYVHHKLHAACAFYRSGFPTATAVIVDGAGTIFPLQSEYQPQTQIWGWETETIFDCSYPAYFDTIYKHIGTNGPMPNMEITAVDPDTGNKFDCVVTESAGIVKTYEGVTEFCGFSSIEAGKTMGLFPYGNTNTNIPPLFSKNSIGWKSNRDIFTPTYPHGCRINYQMYSTLDDIENLDDNTDFTSYNSRRDLAYAVQKETQDRVLDLILFAVEKTQNKNVVFSGGYGLNCVANYHFLSTLNKKGIKLYVEPISNDAGTAMGAAYIQYRKTSKDRNIEKQATTVYLGPQYAYSKEDIINLTKNYNAEWTDTDNEKVVDLITEKNIVAIFQGRSENGPRALGNRSLLFDPRVVDGKDIVNKIKKREYFRPFAGTILEEDVHEWFDLREMDSSPTMMYAVNCKDGVQDKIPSIIHVDGTCRIQTVNELQNTNYYELIKEFKKQTNIPIIFNTSFNLGGQPLVETLEDAFDTLLKSNIEYLYLPETKLLVTMKNIE